MLSTPVRPFANVFCGQRDAFRRKVVRLDEVADRLAEPGAQAVFVRAARAGRDAVDVASGCARRSLPSTAARDRGAALRPWLSTNGDLVNGLGASLGDDLLLIVDESFGVLEDDA